MRGYIEKNERLMEQKFVIENFIYKKWSIFAVFQLFLPEGMPIRQKYCGRMG